MKAIVIETGEIVEVYREPQHGKATDIFKEAVFVNGRMWEEYELDFCIEAEEFPEKIYAYGGEYIRIDKACENLKKLMYDNLMFQGRMHREEVIDNFVETFKDYMKGE